MLKTETRPKKKEKKSKGKKKKSKIKDKKNLKKKKLRKKKEIKSSKKSKKSSTGSKLRSKTPRAAKSEVSAKKGISSLPEMLTTGIIADFLGISTLAVAKWIDNGFIKGTRLPSTTSKRKGRRRVHKNDFTKFLKDQKIPLERLAKEVVLSTLDVAEVAGVSQRTATVWMDNGILPFFRIATKRRLSFGTDVLAFFETNNINTDALKTVLKKRNPGLPKHSNK